MSEIESDHLLQLLVGGKLNGARSIFFRIAESTNSAPHPPVGYNSNAIDSIPSHETLEPFFLEHSHQTPPNALVLRIRTTRLNLPERMSARTDHEPNSIHALYDLQPLQWTNHSPRGSASTSSSWWRRSTPLITRGQNDAPIK